MSGSVAERSNAAGCRPVAPRGSGGSTPSRPIFTVDWEPWFCGTPYGPLWETSDPMVKEPTRYLLDLLRRHQITAVWYIVGWLEGRESPLYCDIVKDQHVIGDHTYYHTYEDWTPEQLANPLFRPPRWHGLPHRPTSGGFFLRAMPYGWLKREVLKEGMFFVHPHDLLWPEQEPTGKWHRRIGLENARDKLERLCREVEFSDAKDIVS